LSHWLPQKFTRSPTCGATALPPQITNDCGWKRITGSESDAGTLNVSPANEAVRRIGPVPSDRGMVRVAAAMPFASVVAVAAIGPMVKVTVRLVNGAP